MTFVRSQDEELLFSKRGGSSLTGAGRIVFPVIMAALGVGSLIKGDFAPVWAPVPKWVPAREILIYVCASISLLGGVGLLFHRTAAAAARLLLAALLLWLLILRLPRIFLAPGVEDSWSGSGETAVMTAGAWVLYACLAHRGERNHGGHLTGRSGVRMARGLYGMALLPFGVAHFVYLKETAALVPHWLPWHAGWAGITGCAFIVAGMAVLTGIYARLAAALSAVQIGLFTLLVWVPIVASGVRDSAVISETILSFALTAGAWVVADSYTGESPAPLAP